MYIDIKEIEETKSTIETMDIEVISCETVNCKAVWKKVFPLIRYKGIGMYGGVSSFLYEENAAFKDEKLKFEEDRIEN